MNTDRELLELAAKVAGEWPSPEPFEHVLRRWNPLTDDGDALRLLVKLGLSMSIQAGAYTLVANTTGEINEDVDHCEDPYAATRRAIVRAAAVIGEKQCRTQ